MKPHTVFLARLLGVFTLISVLWLMLDKQATVSMIPVLLSDRLVMIVLAFVSLGAGLAIVLAHNIWSNGLLPLLVTIVGWILMIRGLLLLFLTNQQLTNIFAALQVGTLFYVYLTVPLLLGAALTYLGFNTRLESRK